MATAVEKPELDEQLDWGVGGEERGAAAARRPAQARQEPARGGLRNAAPLVALEDWVDSRRMRRNLRRGTAVAAAGGASAGGLRELVYRFDDWRVDRQARRFDGAGAAGRRRPLVALAVVVLALTAMGAALAIGSGGS